MYPNLLSSLQFRGACPPHKVKDLDALVKLCKGDEVKIQANAVPSYTLEIVSKEEADKHDVAMVVGSCENGTKKIIYQKNDR